MGFLLLMALGAVVGLIGDRAMELRIGSGLAAALGAGGALVGYAVLWLGLWLLGAFVGLLGAILGALGALWL
ncbi:GlsB/YeaQ/YmgE family stress response membrane protein [Rhodobacteraceae bacterium 2CG4]|uniref:GlsB/YeaQ/YmgE family stress response membrane protein n=1 Tax=Halovulum marinum TaxID=2662447 RepID=A0A6L5YWD4_9RHOB|nr:GlsB/YeaQ/YmgE family stress response membrane protein [Halovulum marinum]MSU88155.1 GlsB/YeaQ/YmgE family stress response membrane protein [Halovulum marinum]